MKITDMIVVEKGALLKAYYLGFFAATLCSLLGVVLYWYLKMKAGA
jgi:hypothetical protein